MNRTEIINKIREIFSMTTEKFGVYKNEEGVEFRIDEMEIEKEVYIITPEGELPAPDGLIELEDGTKVKVMEGKITDLKIEDMEEESEMEEDVEVEVETKEHEEKKMAEATLIDGTIVEVDGELEVGAEIYVKTEEGRQLAPDADHETKEGLIVSTKDGVITEIKEKEEAAEEVKEEELSEILETFANALETLNNELVELKKNNEELNNKFSKFASEPADNKIYDRKGAYIKELMAEKTSKLEQLAALRRGLK